MYLYVVKLLNLVLLSTVILPPNDAVKDFATAVANLINNPSLFVETLESNYWQFSSQ